VVFLRVRLDRVERRNSLTDETVHALIETIERAGLDESIRVIALRGTGPDFCSGFDMGTRPRPETPPRIGATQRQLREGVNRLIPTMLETQTPIVTAATGHVIGLGLGLVLASDFAVVADDARSADAVHRDGFHPRLRHVLADPAPRRRRAGEGDAAPQPRDQRRAGRGVGLVHRAVPGGDVAATTESLVAELASAATVAVGFAKRLVHRGLSTDLDHHLADEALTLDLASRSDDFKEHLRARRDRRDPNFTGR